MTAKKPKKQPWEEMRLFDIEQYPTEEQVKILALEEWWFNRTNEEAAKMLPKAIEYGSVDLDMMGEAMMTLMPQMRGVVPPQELAVAFYLLGKLSRLFGAYEAGRAPSDDTWLDIPIYGRMAQHIREKGHWG